MVQWLRFGALNAAAWLRVPARELLPAPPKKEEENNDLKARQ